MSFAAPFVDFFNDGSALVVNSRCEERAKVTVSYLHRDGRVETRIRTRGCAVNPAYSLMDEEDCIWVGVRSDEAAWFQSQTLPSRTDRRSQVERPLTTLNFWDPSITPMQTGILCTYDYYEGDVSLSALSELRPKTRNHRVIQEWYRWLATGCCASPKIGYVLAVRRYRV